MRNTSTPYGCTICKQEFSNPIYLVMHVEWRHPTEQQTQTLPNINIEDLAPSFEDHRDTQLCRLCYQHVNIEASKEDFYLKDQIDSSVLEGNDLKYFQIHCTEEVWRD